MDRKQSTPLRQGTIPALCSRDPDRGEISNRGRSRKAKCSSPPLESSTCGSTLKRGWFTLCLMKRLLYLLILLAAGVLLACQATSETYDVVILGGRVIDPETGLDAVRNVGIREGTIEAVTEESLAGARVVEADGLVVAPGFIDLHEHGQHLEAYHAMVQDGVTTALELEVGTEDVDSWYREREGGQPI